MIVGGYFPWRISNRRRRTLFNVVLASQVLFGSCRVQRAVAADRLDATFPSAATRVASGAPRQPATAPSDAADPAKSRERAPTVLVEFTNAGSDLLPLLRAELVDLGLTIVEAPPHDAQSPAPSPRPADFRIAIRQDSLEVWMFDRKTSEVTLREVFSRADRSPIEARTAVLHAVELLRWSLRSEEPRESERLTTRKDVSRINVHRPKQWYLGFASIGLHSPGGTKPGLGVAIDVTWRPRPLGIRLLGGTLLVPNTLTPSEGVIEAMPRYLALEAVIGGASPGSRWEFDLAGGISLLWIRLRGTTELALQPHSDILTTAAPMLEGRANYTLGDKVALAVSAVAMVPLRSDAMYVDGREVGRYGQLMLAAGLGLRAALQ